MSGAQRDDGLAVDLQHQAQHAVRRRMLRPHVEDHGAGRCERSSVRGSSRVRCFTSRGFRGSVSGLSSSMPSAVALHRIVLAQRMAFPVLGHHDAAQVGVTVEVNAEEVEDLALVEVGGGPDGGDAVDEGSSRPTSRRRSRTRCFSACERM